MPLSGSRFDVQLKQFMEQVVNSFVKWDLVVFFYENRDVCMSAEKIAERTGRKIREVQDGLLALQEVDLLERRKEGDEECFYLKPDSPWTSDMERFILGLEDFRIRLEFLNHLISHQV